MDVRESVEFPACGTIALPGPLQFPKRQSRLCVRGWLTASVPKRSAQVAVVGLHHVRAGRLEDDVETDAESGVAVRAVNDPFRGNEPDVRTAARSVRSQWRRPQRTCVVAATGPADTDEPLLPEESVAPNIRSARWRRMGSVRHRKDRHPRRVRDLPRDALVP